MVKFNSRTTEQSYLRKGSWSPEEDRKLIAYVKRYGIWNWAVTPRAAGLLRCGKSCRLRWMNYLRPGIKHGNFTKEEDDVIIQLHHQLGNRWSAIASKLPGRTDNEVKNHWHTHLKKHVSTSQGNIQSVNASPPNDSVDEIAFGESCYGELQCLWDYPLPQVDDVSTFASCDDANEGLWACLLKELNDVEI